MFRANRERPLQGSTFSSFNTFNFITGAILGTDVNTDLDDVYRGWLRFGLISPLEYDSCSQESCVPKVPQAFDVLKRLMKNLRKILKKTLYARGHASSRNAQTSGRYSLIYFTMIM